MRVMPSTEICVIHPGALSAACWARLASHLPSGTPVKVLELETINRYWAADPELTVDALAERLRARLGPARARVLVGWGVGGVVAEALAARMAGPARRVVVLDGLAPGALVSEPDEARLLRSFAMFAGARRGRTLTVDPARLTEGVESGLIHILDVAAAAGVLRAGSSPATVRRCFEEHATRALRDHRLTAAATPTGTPLTVVKAANSLAPESPALGWDRFGPVERLGSGGDHYSMLTDSAAAAHLAMLLQRWLAPAFSSVA
jgi:thioesterase domain-containing protein